MKTVSCTLAVLIISACGAFGSDSHLNVKRSQVETQPVDPPGTESKSTTPATGGGTNSQSSWYEAITNSFWMPGFAGWMAVCLMVAATLTAAAISRHCRPQMVVGRCRRIVLEAEACCQVYPEKAQQGFRTAIKRLRRVQRGLTGRCRWRSDSDRILFNLMRPATARLWHDSKDILGRAELGIGLSLLSQQRRAQKAVATIADTRAARLARSCVVAQEAGQFLSSLRDEAIHHLEEAVVLVPKKGECLYALATAYELANRNEDSLAVIQAAITLSPAVDEYYCLLANVAWKTGAYDLYNQGLLGIVESSGRCSRGHHN
jgi:hypothetical protein